LIASGHLAGTRKSTLTSGSHETTNANLVDGISLATRRRGG